MATLNMYRAAIVGCGRIGTATGDPAQGQSRIKSHAEAYCTLPNVDLIALCDASAATLARASMKWGVGATFADVGDLLAIARPDLLSVCAPADQHVEILRMAIEAGVKGVLLEKPITPDLATARSALDLVERAETRVAVNYTRRFPPIYRRAIEDVRAGGIGRVQYVHGIYTKGTVNNGSHMIDLLRAMLGNPVQADALSGDSLSPPSTVSARIIFEGGAEAWLAAADGAAFNVFDLDILGTEGRIKFTDLGHVVQRFTVAETSSEYGFRQLSPLSAPQPTGLAGSVRYAVEDLIESIETRQQPACTVADGYAALEIALSLKGNQ